MCIFGDIDSHPMLPFNRVTMAPVLARNAKTSSAGKMAARFRVFWTVFLWRF